jgi:hypothetical protein
MRARISPCSDQEESRDPPYSDQDKGRYFSRQGAGREQTLLHTVRRAERRYFSMQLAEKDQRFLHTVSRMRAGISPCSEQEESRHSSIK